MNPVEWQKEAESVIASADIEDVRFALYTRLTERYGTRNSLLSTGIKGFDLLQIPPETLGVGIKDAQRLAALKHLERLQEQLSWMGRYFQERLEVSSRGPRPISRFVNNLLKATLLSALSRAGICSSKSISGSDLYGVYSVRRTRELLPSEHPNVS